MSRSRVMQVSAAVDRHWTKAAQQQHGFELGLLLGQRGVLSPSDAVLTAVRVPAELDDAEADEAHVGAAGPRGFADLSSDWVCDVAKQVDRLLPGGMEILGLYVVSGETPARTMDQAARYLRDLVLALSLPSAFQSMIQASSIQPTLHHCVVHIRAGSGSAGPSRGRLAQTFLEVSSLDHAKRKGHSMEISLMADDDDDDDLAMVTFRTSVAVEEQLAWSAAAWMVKDGEEEEVVETRMLEVQQRLLPLAQRVWRAHGVAEVPGSKAPTKEVSNRVELLATAATSDRAGMTATADNVTGQCIGSIECVAYVAANTVAAHKPAVVTALASYYLKRDFIKSLVLRTELLAERYGADAEGDDMDASRAIFRSGGRLSFPQRALLRWPRDHQAHEQEPDHEPSLPALSLLVFQEDGVDEVAMAVENALELLGAQTDAGGDPVATSLTWLESVPVSDKISDSGSSAHGFTPPSGHVAARPVTQVGSSCPPAGGPQSGADSRLLFLLLPVALLLLALGLQLAQ